MDKNTFMIYNDVLYNLYSCTSLTDLRDSFLKRLKLLVPFSYASLLLTDSPDKTVTLSNTRILCCPDYFAEAEREYLAHTEDDPLFWLINGAESTLIRESDILEEEKRLSSPLYQGCYRKYHIYDTLQFSISCQNHFFGILTLYRTKAEEVFSDDDMFRLKSLGLHLNAVVYRLYHPVCGHSTEYTGNLTELTRTYHLTPKESEVLSLLFRFYRNDEIASKMEISENTIQKHLQNLFRKLNVSSKWELLKFIRETAKNVL